jgi:hypothetical protein
VCFDFLCSSVPSATFIIPRRNERDVIKNVYRSACTVQVVLVRF